eukprot:SAG31_NODE_4668_length_3047_cov_1.961330_3_plen_91_part_00
MRWATEASRELFPFPCHFGAVQVMKMEPDFLSPDAEHVHDQTISSVGITEPGPHPAPGHASGPCSGTRATVGTVVSSHAGTVQGTSIWTR